jgi:chromosome segregation ATPase
MMKLGGFFTRKASPAKAPATPADAENPLELDEELFSARGTQIGAENESLRNLLFDASAKIDELDGIKRLVGKLVDPVGKALRAIEAEQVEKAALQTVLNNTRTAYGKLRNEFAELEKKYAASDGERRRLRQEFSVAFGQLKAAEIAKTDLATDNTTRRAQIAQLEARLAQEAGNRKALAAENLRFNEHLKAAAKRINTLESDLGGARQRLRIADDEKRVHQTLLDRASSEAAALSRRLAEAESGLHAAQSRVRHVQANCAELSAERNRIAGALDEANERHDQELSRQRTQFEAMQARMQTGEKLIGEAREHLLARAEALSANEQRLSEIVVERDGLQARLAQLNAELATRESALQELERAHIDLCERAGVLARTFGAKEDALTQSEETVGALNQRIGTLEQTLAGQRQIAERAIEDLKAALSREQMARAVAEGALETARKDFNRVMHELMTLQRQQEAAEPAPLPVAANAA